MTDTESSGDLPEGWVDTTLEELLREPLRNGHSSPKTQGNAGVRTLTLSAVTYGDFSEKNTKLTVADPSKVSDLWLEPRDILIERSNTPELVGTARLYRGKRNFSIFPDLIIRARVVPDISAEFIELVLHTNESRRYFMEKAQGTSGTMPKVDQGVVASIPLRIPPIAEQKRIVARVDELLGRVNAARERLDKVTGILRRFRQSVLAAACSGKLTEDWRERNPSIDVEAALTAIRQRQEALVQTVAQRARIRALYEHSEDGDSDELPEGWRFVALGKLSASIDYGTSVKSQETGKVPVLRMGNIQGGEIDWTDLAYTSDPDEIATYELQPNTVLFNRTNSPELVGKTGIYRGERPAFFAGYLIRVNALPELDPEYLTLCLNAPSAKAFCMREKTDGVSQSNINATKLSTFEVPFCSLLEQQEIVRRVKGLFRLLIDAEKRVTAVSAQAKGLRQGVLAKAYRGELILTEAELARREGRDYESASVLLERICRDRAAGKAKAVASAPRRQPVRAGR